MTTEHPIYRKARAEIEAGRGYGWITAADTAKLIRSQLAAKFPAVKFYVRSETYSGGASIDIYYDGLDHYARITSCHCPAGPTLADHSPNHCRTCGYMGRLEPIYKPGQPAKADVDATASPFAGGRFDGMIDMAYSVRSWLNPDGSATFGESPGTGDQRGSDPGYNFPKTDPNAIRVRFGADHVFVNHELPYDVRERVTA